MIVNLGFYSIDVGVFQQRLIVENSSERDFVIRVVSASVVVRNKAGSSKKCALIVQICDWISADEKPGRGD